ncbi:MAG: DUF423 domain-containing protein [Oleiphilaceae bacterium]|nr:DUF423 domain-containing protein [Oleiphilaceae bacterium]
MVIGGLFALMAVMAGAFGAHSLRGVVDGRGLEIFQTGANYQMYHALALILVSVLSGFSLPRRPLNLAGVFFAAGILLFSGSLYLMVLTQSPALGAITPIGGVCFIVGWVLVVITGLSAPKSPEE